jgi:phage terminase small subunit
MPGAPKRMSKNARTESRRLARELGVTPTAASEELADMRVRLDYESGTEVCRVA